MKTTIENKEQLSVKEQCLEFAQILGLNEPVSEEVLKAAVQNEIYARNLLVSKDSPEMLEILLKNPVKTSLANKEHSTMELVAKAATALLRWGKTGFNIVNQAVLERRENACLSCPNLQEAKSIAQKIVPSLAQKNVAGHRTGKKICALCGCNVSNKMRLPSEACPDKNPENSNQSRWGEPLLSGNIN
ncbi:MAG: hypothetical protein IAF38_04340 [Bacteroidia bacterium]|nr:hypothetical protein [Bacteroidia bacterium]